MNLFEYVSSMKELGGITATIGIGLLCLFLVVIIFKMLGGLRRGFIRQAVSLAFTAASAAAFRPLLVTSAVTWAICAVFAAAFAVVSADFWAVCVLA